MQQFYHTSMKLNVSIEHVFQTWLNS